ncbi:MAG TPA: hypothetical protein VM662_14685 [Sphingomonas sp.]|nr:hypothetical protein [Sphingomonas sp.]
MEESNALAAKIKSEAATCHPLVLAAKMTGFLSPPAVSGAAEHITVEDIDRPVICETRTGDGITEGLLFQFVGQRGESGAVYIFEGFAAIWPDDEKSPRARISSDILQRYVGNYSDQVREVKQRIKPQVSEQERRIKEQLRDFLG